MYARCPSGDGVAGWRHCASKRKTKQRRCPGVWIESPPCEVSEPTHVCPSPWWFFSTKIWPNQSNPRRPIDRSSDTNLDFGFTQDCLLKCTSRKSLWMWLDPLPLGWHGGSAGDAVMMTTFFRFHSLQESCSDWVTLQHNTLSKFELCSHFPDAKIQKGLRGRTKKERKNHQECLETRRMKRKGAITVERRLIWSSIIKKVVIESTKSGAKSEEENRNSNLVKRLLG